MIDLHCHLLPGIDDGSPDMDSSLQMVREAMRLGLHGIVCTPHWTRGVVENTRKAVLDGVRELRKQLSREAIVFNLYPGAELQLDPDLPELFQSGELMTLNDMGKYALIEMPQLVMPPNVDRLFWNLRLMGITPVMSHPERNRLFQKDPEMLWAFVEAGAIVQITAGSLTGLFGSRAKKLAHTLMGHGMCHLLASDAHGPDERQEALEEAFEIVRQDYGDPVLENMIVNNPRRVLEGLPVGTDDAVPFQAPRESWWGRALRNFIKI